MAYHSWGLFLCKDIQGWIDWANTQNHCMLNGTILVSTCSWRGIINMLCVYTKERSENIHKWYGLMSATVISVQKLNYNPVQMLLISHKLRQELKALWISHEYGKTQFFAHAHKDSSAKKNGLVTSKTWTEAVAISKAILRSTLGTYVLSEDPLKKWIRTADFKTQLDIGRDICFCMHVFQTFIVLGDPSQHWLAS